MIISASNQQILNKFHDILVDLAKGFLFLLHKVLGVDCLMSGLSTRIPCGSLDVFLPQGAEPQTEQIQLKTSIGSSGQRNPQDRAPQKRHGNTATLQQTQTVNKTRSLVRSEGCFLNNLRSIPVLRFLKEPR